MWARRCLLFGARVVVRMVNRMGYSVLGFFVACGYMQERAMRDGIVHEEYDHYAIENIDIRQLYLSLDKLH